jgi:hypothetical protein
MRVIGFVKNFSKLFISDTSQTLRNKLIALLMIVAIIMPIISNGSVYEYVTLFTLVFFFLNSKPSIVASAYHLY